MDFLRQYGLLTVLLLLFISGSQLNAVSALSEAEIATLSLLSSTFPQLSQLSQHPATRSKLRFGGPWLSNVEEACSAGDGWNFYGIYCERDAITAIWMYVYPAVISFVVLCMPS